MRISKIGITIAVIFFMGIILHSCDKRRVYEKNIKIEKGIWLKEKPVSFPIDINDTITSHNIYVNIRNSVLYEFSNLFLFINVTAPNENSIRDTLELTLADKSGKWLGNGVTNIREIQRMYKRDVRFALPGIYDFEIQHAMRRDSLHHILDVGLRVERVKQ